MSDRNERVLSVPGAIDSHFHSVEMVDKGLDPTTLLERCYADGLRWAIDVSVNPEDLENRRRLTAHFDRLSYTAGYYPAEANRFASSRPEKSRMMDLLVKQLRDERVVAVGEIGVDGHRQYAPLGTQRDLFLAQLSVASDRHLPVVIHNRQADKPILEAVREIKLDPAGIMHCFSSDYAFARKFVDLGFLISFAGNVTFKNAHELQNTARRLPIDALLVETDAPYLAPLPVRGRPNHPGYVGHTYAFIAKLRHQSLTEFVEHVETNFAGLFPACK